MDEKAFLPERSSIKRLPSTLVIKNVTISGRRTSIRLEPEMWSALREIAKIEQCKINDLCSLVYNNKEPRTSLTAAIRVFLMLYYRAAATEEGHRKAGHGNFLSMLKRSRTGQVCNCANDDISNLHIA